MDTVQHVAHGILISEITLKICEASNSYSVVLLTVLYFLNVTASLLPDLIGWLEKIKHNDNSKWNWYKKVHEISLDNFLIYIPGGLLHIWLDSFMHGEGKRWWIWNERLWLEILGWIITLLIAYLLWS
jgi:hypothetical protein